MPEKEKGAEESKSLEMRLAAIEDKLSKMHITEEEMKAYEKVSGLMGTGAPTPAAGSPCIASQLSPQFCVISRSRVVYCWRVPIITPTFECTCGPCNPQSGGTFGGFSGGFGGFGM